MIRFVFVLCWSGRKYDIGVREVGSAGSRGSQPPRYLRNLPGPSHFSGSLKMTVGCVEGKGGLTGWAEE